MTIILCPTCKKPDTFQSDNPYRPFCCYRCKLIDLGAWADETHRIPATTAPTSAQGE